METLRLVGVGNIGGLQRCWLINHADVIELYDPVRYITGEDSEGLQMPSSCLMLKDNAELVELWFVPGEGNFESSPLTSSGGIFNHKVTFEPPGDWPQMGSKLKRMRRKKWLALFEDTNGTVRLGGGIKQGLRIAYGYSTIKRRYSLAFEAGVAHDAYYLKNFDIEDIVGSTSGFSEGFSFGFRS